MLKVKKKNICVVTGSRAEYGLLYWLMREIKDDPALALQVVVTGMHLEKRFGLTYRQIVKDGFKIAARVPMRLSSDTEQAITRSLGTELSGFGQVFARLRPDLVVLLGDRYEMLGAASAALLFRIPIAHIHGGEVTAGAYDNAVRHALTKLASFHFVAHKDYAARVVQMGEDPKRVFVVGALGLDNIQKLKLLSRQELSRQLDFEIGRDVALVTFHPETMKKGAARAQIRALIEALDRSGLRLVFTMPNADAENGAIFKAIKRYVSKNHGRARLFSSLGQLKYLSLLKEVGLMVGNSSSGILEAPSFRLPTVNIGGRQEGRIKARTIIDADDTAGTIGRALNLAGSSRFRRSLSAVRNPFGAGGAGRKIKQLIKHLDLLAAKPGFIDL